MMVADENGPCGTCQNPGRSHSGNRRPVRRPEPVRDLRQCFPALPHAVERRRGARGSATEEAAGKTAREQAARLNSGLSRLYHSSIFRRFSQLYNCPNKSSDPPRVRSGIRATTLLTRCCNAHCSPRRLIHIRFPCETTIMRASEFNRAFMQARFWSAGPVIAAS